MSDIKLGGIIDISTKEIPGKASMVLFTVGCNFNCDYCHNKYLLQLDIGKHYQIEELVRKIESNSLVSGVSITGGEPTLQNDLLEFVKKMAKLGKYISIDTNGSNPAVIESISPYINRIALDLKGPFEPEKLEKITGVKVDISKIRKTIDFLKTQKDIDFEIRTTYLQSLLSSIDIENIINSLRNLEFKGNFVLQQYQFLEGVGEEFKKIFSKPEHDTLINILRPYRDIELELPFRIFLRDEIVGYCAINEIFID